MNTSHQTQAAPPVGASAAPPSGVPVVFFIFNRPATTAKVLERIRAARPSRLLLVADGPRADRPGESELCRRVRELVLSGLDWKPDLLTDFSEKNLGCRARISSGLDWAFEQVEEAIILEDDCLPDATFFRFTAELLAYYRNDTRIGVISGDNFQPQPLSGADSYYFSKFNHCWGWATWKRAWKYYDHDMRAWPALRESGWLEGLFPRREYSAYWRGFFDQVAKRRIDTWDYTWTFSCWAQSLLSVLPRANLVTNIGAGPDATHTHTFDPGQHFLRTCPMAFPLVHPASVVMNHAADDYSQAHLYGEAKLKTLAARFRRLRRKVRRRLSPAGKSP
jgi:hypothetical protein